MARRIPRRFWIPLSLSFAGLGACVVANYQLVSWSMLGMTGGAGLVGPFFVSDVAAAVITCLIVAMSVYLVEFSGRDPISGQIAALPKNLRRRATIVTGFLLLSNTMAQTGTVYIARLDHDTGLAHGGGAVASESVVLGFSFSASDPMLLGLAIVLPALMLGFSLILTRQLSGALGAAAGAASNREGVVTRV